MNTKQWEITDLKNVAEVIAGQSPKSEFYNKIENGLPFYQGKKDFGKKLIKPPTNWTTKITKIAIENDILMSVRAPVGPINFATQEICIGRGLAAIRSSDDLDKEFLFYFLLKHENEIVGNTGAVFNSINKTQIGSIQIPIPPLAEQKQIVALLDQAFAAIDQAKANLEKNIQNAQELFQSKLNAIFSQPALSGVEGSGEGWVEKRLGDVISITHGYAFKSQNFITDYNGKNPIVLTPGNFSEDSRLYFTQKNTKRCISDFPEEYKFNEGDLVVVMTDLSSKMKILGKPAVIDSKNILHNQRIGRVIFNTDEIERDMLYYFFQSDDYLSAIKSTATGTMVRHTAPKRILANKVSFPTSNKQQKKIINTLNNIRIYKEKVVMNYQTKLNNLEELKKSILQKAFNGELT
ncbi:MAG: restriction endonuclease subunit S [Cocleimonas sp.]|nr:restriction endonuclease subunit S [Cocleimonas sp.]